MTYCAAILYRKIAALIKWSNGEKEVIMKILHKLRLQRIRLRSIIIGLLFSLIFVVGGQLLLPFQYLLSPPILDQAAWAEDLPADNIQWFKDEMRIAPKYQEHEQGLLGMSWMHFISMIFLVFFFIAALVMMYIRNKQTKKILNNLLKEE